MGLLPRLSTVQQNTPNTAEGSALIKWVDETFATSCSVDGEHKGSGTGVRPEHVHRSATLRITARCEQAVNRWQRFGRVRNTRMGIMVNSSVAVDGR